MKDSKKGVRTPSTRTIFFPVLSGTVFFASKWFPTEKALKPAKKFVSVLWNLVRRRILFFQKKNRSYTPKYCWPCPRATGLFTIFLAMYDAILFCTALKLDNFLLSNLSNGINAIHLTVRLVNSKIRVDFGTLHLPKRTYVKLRKHVRNLLYYYNCINLQTIFY